MTYSEPMVEIKDLKESYEPFWKEFQDIRYEFRKNKDAFTLDELEEKIVKSDYYNKLKKYLEEQDCKIINEGWVEIEKGDWKWWEIDSKKGNIPIIKIKKEKNRTELYIDIWGDLWNFIEELNRRE